MTENVKRFAWLFHATEWGPADGMIRRSKPFDKLTFDRGDSGGNFDFTSIILDATKPLKK